MPRTILVTEGDSPLGAALVRLFVARGYAVAAASPAAASAAARPSSAAGGPARSPLTLPWNRRSPVSGRAVVLSTLNAFERLDEVVILEPPYPAGSLLQESASADIERAFDDVKGPVFLAREVLVALRARGGGVMSFVSGGQVPGPAAGPVECAAREAFRGLASAVLAAPGNGSIVANAFQGTVDPEEYAAFIDRTLEEKARKITGRWFTYPPRGGLLSRVRTSSNP
jgi:NAD(P)-dependent dehydrogenase (short-subunit alcohol dehydrogenase family)